MRLEKQIESDVVKPILGVLGWDFSTSTRAEQEYDKIPGKKIDFVLKSDRSRPVIFIEAKNLGALNNRSAFTDAQNQLFGYFDAYSHKRDVKLLLLTEGDKWFFYKPEFRDYRSNELMFKKVSLLDEDPQEMADLLSRLLSIEFVDGGTFSQNVDDAFNAHVDYLKAQEVFPEFMRTALKEPSEELCQILLDSFKSSSGIETLDTPQIRNLISDREDDYEKAKKAFPDFLESELREPSEVLAEEIGRTFSDKEEIDLDLPAIQSLIKNHRFAQPSPSAVEEFRPSYPSARKNLTVTYEGIEYTGNTASQTFITVLQKIGSERAYHACKEARIKQRGNPLIMKTRDISPIKKKGQWNRIDGEYSVNTNSQTPDKCSQLNQIASVLRISHLLKAEIREDTSF